MEKKVQRAFKTRLKNVRNRLEAFRSVLELTQAVCSGNNRSIFFLLNLAKLIDSGVGVETSTIKRIQDSYPPTPLAAGERVRAFETVWKRSEAFWS